jgi:gliding motility-associated-like protein
VRIADVYGCSNTLSGTGLIEVYPIPEAKFKAAPKVADIWNPEIRFSQLSGPMKTYAWEFGDGETSGLADPVHTYPDTGTYQVCLEVTSNMGCEDIICDEVKILPVPDFFAPNAFTPNSDQHNEYFKIIASYVVEFKMEIFDRWGEMLFVSEKGEEGWDGTYKGNKVQSDTYVWRVTLKDSLMQDRQVYGRVTLID